MPSAPSPLHPVELMTGLNQSVLLYSFQNTMICATKYSAKLARQIRRLVENGGDVI